MLDIILRLMRSGFLTFVVVIVILFMCLVVLTQGLVGRVLTVNGFGSFLSFWVIVGCAL